MRHESGENIRFYTLPNEKKKKNLVSIPDQDETKNKPSPLQLLTTPKERRKIIYKQKLRTTAYWGGGKRKAPLLHFHAQKSLFSHRKKLPALNFL